MILLNKFIKLNNVQVHYDKYSIPGKLIVRFLSVNGLHLNIGENQESAFRYVNERNLDTTYFNKKNCSFMRQIHRNGKNIIISNDGCAQCCSRKIILKIGENNLFIRKYNYDHKCISCHYMVFPKYKQIYKKFAAITKYIQYLNSD